MLMCEISLGTLLNLPRLPFGRRIQIELETGHTSRVVCESGWSLGSSVQIPHRALHRASPCPSSVLTTLSTGMCPRVPSLLLPEESLPRVCVDFEPNT